jgi:hypothetical protein
MRYRPGGLAHRAIELLPRLLQLRIGLTGGRGLCPCGWRDLRL